VLSRNSSSAKYTGALRRGWSDPSGTSVSCQEASRTTGTRIAISRSITRAMPSAAKVNLASQLGIHR
jgi:hypothetical protein